MILLQREGLSPYNKIYEFNYNFRGRNAKMTMTSVSGHLLNHEFVGQYRKWLGCSPDALFDAPVMKECSEDYLKIKVGGCSNFDFNYYNFYVSSFSHSLPLKEKLDPVTY